MCLLRQDAHGEERNETLHHHSYGSTERPSPLAGCTTITTDFQQSWAEHRHNFRELTCPSTLGGLEKHPLISISKGSHILAMKEGGWMQTASKMDEADPLCKFMGASSHHR